ncbi:MAG: hypothetical protein J1E39_02090 [Eubacterium sp.]|nr:hypothetical protein [Eubacterium sp.]
MTQEEMGGADIAPTMTGDHNGHISDYTALVCCAWGFPLGFRAENTQVYDEKATTICNGTRPGHCNGVIYTIDRAAFNQEENALYAEISDSITAKGPSAVAYGVDCRNYAINKELYPTLQAKESGGQSLNYSGAVCYNICSDKSNAMLSDNPYSGIYKTEITRTLDGNGGNHTCNQGGTIILQRLIKWIIRRLTPLEEERLQGYPDYWTTLPKITDMSEEDYEFWKTVLFTDKQLRGKKYTAPTKTRLIKWYNELDKDGPRYMACGNSIAVPCGLRVVGGIADYIRGSEDT